MSKLGEKLRKLRGNESLREASNKIGISHTYLDTLEKGYDKRSGKPSKPTPETLKLIAKAYDYPYEELMALAGYIDVDENETNETTYTYDLTEKDKKDIAKRMEKIKKDLSSDGGLSFYGEPLSEEAKESLLEAMEYAVKTAQKLNKKYIPKKYRDKNN